ncbi:DUF1692-domain-containing protein [Cylindrobasidium torrendii FP15055 ss-10]|uniref:DUF1692-domain-containing protein n=1 Tax=Cylindrobasidium torrendii FP15055 ss-10 TaxID=1314674 RepID=A0A0D7B6U3_9AGAR|nr:DUF1692-domain-containing protein [Cylindrobasidium torrendii FP15055 ss-10]
MDDNDGDNPLIAAIPPSFAKFDAFPKLPASYKTRSGSRGILTLLVGFLAFLLMLNDLGEYVFGWPDYEFAVDRNPSSALKINVDLVVNMPCKYLSIDLRDAVGDRLFLSAHGLRRDGTKFDLSQATKLKEHAAALSAREAISQSRQSRGLLDGIFRRSSGDLFKPTYNYEKDASACRIYGTVETKKVTANLHVTTLGHGYSSREHVDHKFMNLSHVITEFSFGPHFPEIVQPLDNSFEVAVDPFVAYQYFLHVVPTTYVAPRSSPLETNQYSVTHYTRIHEHNKGTPGIFFKFDLDPMQITVHQRTTSLLRLIMRCIGVIGGVFVCMGYALRVTSKAVEVVSGAEDPGLVSAEASGAKVGLRTKWGGGEIRSRQKIVRQGSSWESGSYSPGPASAYSPSPYTAYNTTPVGSPFIQQSSYLGTPGQSQSPYFPGTPNSSMFGPPPTGRAPPPPPSRGGVPPNGPPTGLGVFAANPLPGTPSHSIFPPTPNPIHGGGFPKDDHKKDD